MQPAAARARACGASSKTAAPSTAHLCPMYGSQLILLPDDCSLPVKRQRKRKKTPKPAPVPLPPPQPAPTKCKGFKQEKSTYRISVSPSGRGHCRRCRSVIAKGETRLEVCAFVRPGRYTLLLRYMGQGGWDGGVGSGGARGRRGARAAAPGPRAAAACDVPPVARGDARGAAVVGRRAGRRGAVPRPVRGVRERGARRGVCALSVRSAARPPRGWCCSLWTTRTATGRSWLGGEGLGEGDVL